MSSLWQGMEVGLGLQQQCMQRWALRQQEAWQHWQHASVPAVWMDVSLAGMRWGLQEWDQALQDSMAVPVFLRGDAAGQELAWMVPCGQWAQLPWQLWTQCWVAAGQQRPR